MDNGVKCPYCGGSMFLNQYSDCLCYECGDCGSESPAVESIGRDYDKVCEEAKELALKRV